MSYFEWSDDFSVENDDMDTQHRKLIAFINHFYDAADSGASQSELINCFDKIVNYTSYHFREEEKLMEAADFKDFKKHKYLHEKLVSRVLSLKSDLELGKPDAARSIQEFLKFWLTSHIKGIDKNYAGII